MITVPPAQVLVGSATLLAAGGCLFSQLEFVHLTTMILVTPCQQPITETQSPPPPPPPPICLTCCLFYLIAIDP